MGVGLGRWPAPALTSRAADRRCSSSIPRSPVLAASCCLKRSSRFSHCGRGDPPNHRHLGIIDTPPQSKKKKQCAPDARGGGGREVSTHPSLCSLRRFPSNSSHRWMLDPPKFRQFKKFDSKIANYHWWSAYQSSYIKTNTGRYGLMSQLFTLLFGT